MIIYQVKKRGQGEGHRGQSSTAVDVNMWRCKLSGLYSWNVKQVGKAGVQGVVSSEWGTEIDSLQELGVLLRGTD